MNNRVLLAGVVLVSGCVANSRTAPPPLVAQASAAEMGSRTLQDEGLRRFLVQDLGRDPGQPASWDFNTLTWVAFYYHPSLAVARAQWDLARAGETSASARPNPTVTVTPGYNSNPGDSSPWFPGIGADIPFETGGKRAGRTEAARLTSEASRQDVFAAAWKVRSELRQALSDLAANEQRLGLQATQVQLQADILALLNQRFQAGALSAVELSAERVALARAQAAFADAERQGPSTRQRVAEALGIPVSALPAAINAVRAPASLTDQQLSAARGLSLRSRPDVLAALARYDSARASLSVETARRYPDIHFGPSYQWDQGANKWSLGVTVEIPVFNRNEGPIAEADARCKAAAADFLAIQSRVISEIDSATAEQAGAARMAANLRGLQGELAQLQSRLQARQTAGAADRLEVLNGQMELLSGRLALIDADAQAVSAAGHLEDALQVPFGDLDTLVSLNRDTKSPSSP